MTKLVFKDEIRLLSTTIDEYSAESIDETAVVPALFIRRTGWQQQNHQSTIDSDAEVYVDINNSFVSDNYYRLEEMYAVITKLGDENNWDDWYKVVSVSIGQDKLLGNSVDNVLLRLKKTKGFGYVS